MNQQSVIDLFKVDLDYSSLKDFLNELVHTVNEQGRQIENMNFTLNKCITKEKCAELIQSFGDNLECQDPEVNQLVNMQLNQTQTTGDLLIDASNIFNSKLQYILEIQNQIIRRERQNSQQLKKQLELLEQKSNKNWVQDKIDTLDLKLQNQFEQDLMELKRNLSQLRLDVKQQIDELYINIRESEKKTIWKIDECEKIIIQKVNKDYVDTNMQYLEKKLFKSFQNIQDNLYQDYNNRIYHLEAKSNQLDEDIQTFKKKLKLDHDQLKQEQIFNKRLLTLCVQNQQFEAYQFMIKQKTDELMSLVQLVDAKGDPREFYKRSLENIKTLQESIFEFEKKNIGYKQQISDFGTEIAILKDKSSSTAQVKESLHHHDICQAEAEMNHLRDTFSNMIKQMQDSERLTRQKIGSIEMNVMNTIANKRNEMQIQQIVKEDVLMTVDRLYGGFNEKIKDLTRRQDEMLYNVREINKILKI